MIAENITVYNFIKVKKELINFQKYFFVDTIITT